FTVDANGYLNSPIEINQFYLEIVLRKYQNYNFLDKANSLATSNSSNVHTKLDNPINWWSTCEDDYNHLQKLAIKLFSYTKIHSYYVNHANKGFNYYEKDITERDNHFNIAFYL
ncbi:12578_t:CDS:2, partial [Entrophospora sp. SA101]